MNETERSKEILPMNFDAMKDLRTTIQINLLALGAIKFIIDYGLIDSGFKGNITDLADGISLLLDYWIEHQEAEITKAVDEFENMDMVLIHSAETIVNQAKGGNGIPTRDESLRIRKAMKDMEIIMQNPAMKHGKASQIKAVCEELVSRL